MTESTSENISDRIQVSKGRIVIEPITSIEYRLDDLLAAITPDNCHGEIDFGKPVGKEMI